MHRGAHRPALCSRLLEADGILGLGEAPAEAGPRRALSYFYLPLELREEPGEPGVAFLVPRRGKQERTSLSRTLAQVRGAVTAHLTPCPPVDPGKQSRPSSSSFTKGETEAQRSHVTHTCAHSLQGEVRPEWLVWDPAPCPRASAETTPVSFTGESPWLRARAPARHRPQPLAAPGRVWLKSSSSGACV